jgi:hypothetical protein
MSRSIVLFEADSGAGRLRRIVEFVPGVSRPARDALLTADAVELCIQSLDTFARARAATADLYEALDRPVPPILLRIHTCLDDTATEALDRFDTEIGGASAEHLTKLWFVGTVDGLHGLVRDLCTLEYGDGVSIVPIDDVLPANAIAS